MCKKMRLTLFGDRPTRLPMNSTKQPNTAELLMKPVRTSPGWREQAEVTIKNMTVVHSCRLERRRTCTSQS